MPTSLRGYLLLGNQEVGTALQAHSLQPVWSQADESRSQTGEGGRGSRLSLQSFSAATGRRSGGQGNFALQKTAVRGAGGGEAPQDSCLVCKQGSASKADNRQHAAGRRETFTCTIRGRRRPQHQKFQHRSGRREARRFLSSFVWFLLCLSSTLSFSLAGAFPVPALCSASGRCW